MVDFVLFVWHLRIYELYNDSECFFSEESMGDIEKRTRSHDLWSLRLTGLKSQNMLCMQGRVANVVTVHDDLLTQ